jgi:predicted AlkP superfamily pyrophosphatase or phosphodiesterase
MIRAYGLASLLVLQAATAGAAPLAQHVFIISIDGGKPAAIRRSHMPVLERLAAEGACTWNAQTIFPSLTLPSHTSMLTGVGPEKHHILWNKWKPNAGVVQTPTIFAEASRRGLSTAMFVGKEKFRHLLQPGTVDEFEFDELAAQPAKRPFLNWLLPARPKTVTARVVAQRAADYILRHKPNLCFIHFTDPDDAGHEFGWGSPQQLGALASVDAALGRVLEAIEQAGIEQESVVIVTADHGGHKKTHGSRRPEDTTIPWMVRGKDVKRGSAIAGTVGTCDTAATALWLLGLPCRASLDGHPVTGAFTGGWVSSAAQIPLTERGAREHSPSPEPEMPRTN